MVQDTQTQQIIRKQSEPQPKHIDAPYIFRRPPNVFTNYVGLRQDQWREVVARAPVVGVCIRTLITQITAIPWAIIGDDEEEVKYYTSVLQHANGENHDTFVERLVQDVLTIPFGGAVEVVRYPTDGVVASTWHVDASTMFPTYDEELLYVQVNPDNTLDREYFDGEQIKRIMWAPRSDIKNYGWSKTPLMEVLPTIEAVMRSDVFYANLLSDTPEAGILDLMDMKQEAAQDWVKSWQSLMIGIDALKVPVLYEHEKAAQFIPFTRSPSELTLPELVKRLVEIVVAAFGMNIGDLGLYEHTNTKAGTSASIALSKRQGLGALLKKITSLYNESILPDTVNFKFNPIDEEDKLKKSQTERQRAETLKILGTADPSTGQPLFPANILRKQAIQDGLITVITMDDVDDLEEEMLEALEETQEAAEDMPEIEDEEEEDVGDDSKGSKGKEEVERVDIQSEEIKDLPEDDQQAIGDMASEWHKLSDSILSKRK